MKSRGGGQELSAEVIRAADLVSWYPALFDSFCFKHISLLCAPIVIFFCWYPPFSYYRKDFKSRSGIILKNKKGTFSLGS